MGDVEKRNSKLIANAMKEGNEPVLEPRIETTHRFIEKKKPRRRKNRARETDPLLFAAGEARDIAFEKGRDFHHLHNMAKRKAVVIRGRVAIPIK